MKTIKIKPEWCDSKAEESLVYEVIEDSESRVLARVVGNPFGFAIEPIESFEKHMIIGIN